MLVLIKNHLHQHEIIELLGYSVFPDDEELKATVEQYKANDHLFLLGYSLEDEIIGLIGYEMVPDNSIKLNHIAVHPEFRAMGYGRGMILELIDKIEPRKIIAEVGEEAVDFYRNIGFEIISLGESAPNSERFECTFITDFA